MPADGINLNDMKQVCKFKKGTDISETVPGLQANVCSALESGKITSSVSEVSYNQQKTFDEVGKRVSEPFDVIEYDRQYSRLRKDVNDSIEDV